MKFNEVFGFLLILLAIYLGINASGRDDVGADLFDGDDTVVDDGAADDPDVEIDPDGGKLSGDGDGDGDGERPRRPAGNEGVVSRSDFCAAARGSTQFDDLGRTHDEAIRCMARAGVVTGESADTYAPRDALTRAQAASTIAAMIGASNDLEEPGVNLRSLPDAPDTRFADVAPDSPHADAIARLNEAGIITGYVDARYEPQGRVSKAQMASILDRTYKFMTDEALPGGNDQFDDDRSVHEDSINAVAQSGIMNGDGRRFDPNRSVRRGPMATWAARIVIRLEETDRIRPLD